MFPDNLRNLSNISQTPLRFLGLGIKITEHVGVVCFRISAARLSEMSGGRDQAAETGRWWDYCGREVVTYEMPCLFKVLTRASSGYFKEGQ